MAGRVEGKIAFVTGGGSGMGREHAILMAEEGASLIVSDVNEAGGRETVSMINSKGGQSLFINFDVASEAAWQAAVNQAVSTFGRVDILVNNAAVFPRTPWSALNEAAWDEAINTNLKGSFLVAKAVGDRMKAQGAGKIVNIADWAGERPYRDYLPYCVSKAGVIALTKALALELAPEVQVNAVAPGPVMLPDDMSAKERAAVIAATPLRRIGSPEDIANAVLFLLEGSDFITGAVLPVDGGRLIA